MKDVKPAVDIDPEEVQYLKEEAEKMVEESLTALIYQDSFTSTMCLMVEIHYFYDEYSTFTKIVIESNKLYEMQCKWYINIAKVKDIPTKSILYLFKKDMLHLALQHIVRVRKFKHKVYAELASNLVIWDCLFPYLQTKRTQVKEHFTSIDGRYLSNADLALPDLDRDNQEYNLEGYYELLLMAFPVEEDDQINSKLLDIIEIYLSEEDREDPSTNVSLNNWDINDEGLDEKGKRELDNLIENSLTTLTNKATDTAKPGDVPGKVHSFLEKKKAKDKVKGWKQLFKERSSKNKITKQKTALRRNLNFKSKSKRKGSTVTKYRYLYKHSEGEVRNKIPSLICVAVDVSGSVSNEQIKDIYSHLDYISTTYKAEILISQFDTEVKSFFTTYSNRDSKIEVIGRGGTNFQCVVDAYKDLKKQKPSSNFKSLFIFSDGEAVPPICNNHKEIVYIITKPSNLGTSYVNDLSKKGSLVIGFNKN